MAPVLRMAKRSTRRRWCECRRQHPTMLVLPFHRKQFPAPTVLPDITLTPGSSWSHSVVQDLLGKSNRLNLAPKPAFRRVPIGRHMGFVATLRVIVPSVRNSMSCGPFSFLVRDSAAGMSFAIGTHSEKHRKRWMKQ